MTIIIVGGGKMGLSHLAIASQILGSKNVVLCETNLLMRFLYKRLGIKTYSSVELALAACSEIKGAIISTPTPSHYLIAKLFLENSIPCFIEKPLTLSAKKSLHLLSLSLDKKVYAQMGFVLRYVSSFSKLRDLLQSNALGPPLGYSVQMTGNVITKSDSKSWRTNFAAGGGCLNEYGPHLIDLCRFIFGDVAVVNGAKKSHVFSENADDRINFEWTHDSGVAGKAKLDWCDPNKRKSIIEFTINFQGAEVSANNSALHFTFNDACTLTLDERIQISKSSVPPRVGFYLRGEEYSLQLEDFIGKCVNQICRVDSKFGIGNSAELSDGLAVDQLIESIALKAELV